MAPEIFRAERLTRRYRDLPVVSGVSLSLAAGEGVCLLGGNGAGKTTLLGMAATLIPPSAGTLCYRGAPAAEALPEARGRIGYASHESLLYRELTVRENLAFHRRLHRSAADLDALLDAHRLAAWADLPARLLSRGTAQRVSLARAFLHEPELLLLDEPFAGLDGPARDRLTAALRRAREAGAALLLATHDLDRGLEVTDRALVLRAGQVVFSGPNADRPTIERAYADRGGDR